MSTFLIAVQECIGLHKRQDKVAETKFAINTALNELTRLDKFRFDLEQYDKTLTTLEQSQTVVEILLTEIPFPVRSIESIITSSDSIPLDLIKPAHITRPGVPATGVYYGRRTGFMTVLRAPADIINVSYYVGFERLVGDTDTHWGLDLCFPDVIERALGHFYTSIGQDKDAKLHTGLAGLAYERVRRDLR